MTIHKYTLVTMSNIYVYDSSARKGYNAYIGSEMIWLTTCTQAVIIQNCSYVPNMLSRKIYYNI